ncbi:MAG: SH3 domain-containing protein, partial [Clostridiales bacterium]|nr:SH3 domain-containing protein [Clostridiales bacterium]
MKKFIFLLLIIFSFSLSVLAENQPDVLYKARLIKAAPLKEKPDKMIENLAMLSEKEKVEILELYPDWLLIRTSKDQTGYIQRRYIDFNRVEPADPAKTPQYPAILSEYISWVNQTTSLRAQPDAASEAIITLSPGVRLAIIGIENGWAKLIYHRQYAFVDSRHLSELMPLEPTAQTADSNAPIAAYTSFYR